MMNFRDYITLGQRMGYAMNGSSSISTRDGAPQRTVGNRGDVLLSLDNLRRARKCSFEEACENQDFNPETPSTLVHFAESYRLFKKELGKMDFADQLERFLDVDEELDIDYLFVDEAQDLSRLQWSIVDILKRPAKHVFIAGDDKQAIYEFSGGDPEALIQMEGERIVLDTCYRLPANILNFAESVAGRISSKTPYTVKPHGEGGTVERIRTLSALDMTQGTWLLLGRNRSHLEMLESAVIGKGLLYKCATSERMPESLIRAILSWKALLAGQPITGSQAKLLYAKYLPSGPGVARGFKQAMAAAQDTELFSYDDLKDDYGLRTSEPWHSFFSIGKNLKTQIVRADDSGSLDSLARIEITTIHSTKGREADNVVILPDMAWVTFNQYRDYPDGEHRTFYVAATRARQSLFIYEPITQNFYDFPRTQDKTSS